MNEILQQRIESVRAGKDLTHAQISAKRSLREQLEKDMAEFAEKGGKVHELATGFSHFKDGLIPTTAVRPVINEQDRLAREKAIEAKNQEIRMHKAALKQERQMVAKKRHDAQIKEQIEILGRFESKSVNKADMKRLADMADYQVRHMRNATKGHTKFSPEKWDLLKKAIATFEFAAAPEPVKKSKRVGSAA